MAESERFASVDDENLEALLDNKDSKNTKTCIKSAVNILTAFCASRLAGLNASLFTTSVFLIFKKCF
jgi:hypothetical protein